MVPFLSRAVAAVTLSTSLFMPCAAQAPDIPPQLSIDKARSLFLLHNPQLRAARLEIDIEEADILQVDRYPNPSLSVGAEGLGTAGPGSFLDDQEFSVTLRQPLLTGGKRKKRTLVEEADVNVARREIANLERLLLFELKESYFQVVLAQEELQLANQILERFREVVRLNRLRFDRGEISGGELRRVEAAQYRFLEDQIRAEVTLRTSRDRLLALFGISHPGADFTATDSLEASFFAPPLEELRQAALKNREDVAAQEARIRRSEAQTTLETALRRPDPSIFAGYRRDFGESGAIVGVELPLFVFHRNQGAIARSLAETRQATSRLQYLEVEVSRELQAALTELEGSRRRIQLLEGEYLRIAEQSRDTTESAYRLGAASLIELLEAERTYRETRLVYNRALFDFQISRARLSLAVGVDV